MRDQTKNPGETKMTSPADEGIAAARRDVAIVAEAMKALDDLAFSNSNRHSMALTPIDQRIFWVGSEAWVVNKYGQVYPQGHSDTVWFDLTAMERA